jgi:transposase
MDIAHPRCAGLDVHKDTVVACVRVVEGGRVRQEVRTHRTTTSALLELHDWLAAERCSHVAMESTGVYWKPVWHILEGGFALVLANAMHIKNVPGRKTDVNDAMWIADLLAHGLIRGSFVPPQPIQDLRDLTRTRSQLTKERARHVQRIQKTLEDANIKLTGLVQDILGVTGRAILRALIAGETDPDGLVPRHLHGRLKATREQLVEALRGSVREHHRFLLRLHLAEVESLEATVAELEARIGDALATFRDQIERLATIPGVSRTTAPILLAEIGPDMSRFPTAGHLISWAGLCPGNDESAGKRRSTRLRSGDPWLRSALVQAAWPAARKKGSSLRSQYLRIKARRGAKKAAVAVAASILTAAYYILLRGVPYQEFGALHPVQPDRQKTANQLIRKLKSLGLRVEVKPAA